MIQGRYVGVLVLALTSITGGSQTQQNQDRILFVSDRDGNREIYAMEADGSRQTNLSHHTGRDQAPAISPDGRTVAFASDRSGQLGIWLMNINGDNARLLIELPAMDFGLEWSPDGVALALSLQGPDNGPHDIAILDVVTAQLTLLTHTEDVEELTPTWSPDGTRLYYVRDDGSGSTLVALTLAGGTIDTVLPTGIGPLAFPKLSPDGRHALLRSRANNQFDVLLVDLESATVENITNHQSNDWGGIWSRDGGTIVFASDRDGDMEIYIITLADRTAHQLTYNEARDWMPVW